MLEVLSLMSGCMLLGVLVVDLKLDNLVEQESRQSYYLALHATPASWPNYMIIGSMVCLTMCLLVNNIRKQFSGCRCNLSSLFMLPVLYYFHQVLLPVYSTLHMLQQHQWPSHLLIIKQAHSIMAICILSIVILMFRQITTTSHSQHKQKLS